MNGPRDDDKVGDRAADYAIGCGKPPVASHQDLFTTRLSQQKAVGTRVRDHRGRVPHSTSVGGELTGRGANYIIIDDPLKPAEAFVRFERQRESRLFDGASTVHRISLLCRA